MYSYFAVLYCLPCFTVLVALAHRLTDPQPELLREFIFAAGGSLLLVAAGAL